MTQTMQKGGDHFIYAGMRLAQEASMFFKCSACRSSQFFRKSFPLCLECAQSLVKAPPLCSQCGNAFCGSICDRPWIRHAWIESFHAQYLLIEPGYTVLKSWKKTGGLSLDQQIIPSVFTDIWELGVDYIIPIPQEPERSWRLGGSPAERIAARVAPAARARLLLALEKVSRNQKRQGELLAHERLRSILKYRVLPQSQKRLEGSVCLLVDDFMTTGHTLRNAAAALKRSGVSRIHAFALGVRPLKIGEKTQLLKGA